MFSWWHDDKGNVSRSSPRKTRGNKSVALSRRGIRLTKENKLWSEYSDTGITRQTKNKGFCSELDIIKKDKQAISKFELVAEFNNTRRWINKSTAQIKYFGVKGS